MKKIMFNDRFGLTQAVLEGRKTQTRRVISVNFYNRVNWKYFEEGHNDCIIDDDISILDCGNYQVDEVVAIAQSYQDCGYDGNDYITVGDGYSRVKYYAGWTNKMFVRAKAMKHHIKITNVRVERLQDISEEDCIAEGIEKGDFTNTWDTFFFREGQNYITAKTARIAYSKLIDKVGKKGTWESNPWVFVYDFELVD